MKYLDGQTAMVGDQVDLGGEMIGIVVCSFTKAYALQTFL